MGRVSSKVAVSLGRFGRDTSGAVTVNWIILTACLVGMALAVLMVIGTGATRVSASISDDMDTVQTSISFASESAGEVAEMTAPQPKIAPVAPPTAEERFVSLELATFNAKQKDRRWDRLAVLPEKNVRNQHRRWTTRASNPDYDNPERARDQVQLIELAMDARDIPRS